MDHQVVSREDWLAARKTHLEAEKALTRQRDKLLEARRALPWVKVEKDYVFEGPDGPVTLGDLFAGRSQLFVQHFMLGPDWKEGCTGCSFQADHVDAARQHFEHADLSFVAVSRAPYERIAAFKRRMGWRFPWVSSFGNDFNFDYHVSFRPEELERKEAYYNYATIDPGIDELPGMSVFAKDDGGAIYHTYSSYARGGEELIGAFMFLDMVPKGRNEPDSIMQWVRHHDRYDDAQPKACHSAAE
ncbi:MAG TPA: thioredoxin family protein [Kiloniellaceae bacterium]